MCFPWNTNENRTGVKGSAFSKRLVAINMRMLYYSSHDCRAACFSNFRASAYAIYVNTFIRRILLYWCLVENAHSSDFMYLLQNLYR